MDTTFLLNNILKSDGTNQDQRLLPALDPDFIKVDERGIKELLSFTYGLSKEINFFDLKNQPDGDWQEFFSYFVDPVTDEILLSEDEIINILRRKNDFDPHFGLFLAFLQLFVFAQNDINKITKNHLDFYYTKVLQFLSKPPVPDKVHLILALDKNLANHKIDAGTTFKAVKDASGVPLYTADHETVINKAQIQNVKSIFIHDDPLKDDFTVYAADAANSADGKGKPFTSADDPKWSAFGEDQTNKTSSEQNMQPAVLGFAFSSPMLLLNGGDRQITLTIEFNDVPEAEQFGGDIGAGVQLSLSGEKGWIEPKTFSVFVDSKRLDPPNDTMFSCKLIISILLPSTEPAVIPFSSALHGGVFSTVWPVLQVQLNNGAAVYNDLYNLQVKSGSITVAVTGLKNLLVQNDLSQLNPAKPFQPFGPVPNTGSDFYIGSAEVFQKKLSSFNINILWNGVPASNLGNYYTSYSDVNTSFANVDFTASLSLLYKDRWIEIENAINPATGYFFLFDIDDATAPNTILINADSINDAFSGLTYERNTDLQQLSEFNNTTHDGFIRLEIKGPDAGFPFKAFGHNEFSNIYAKRAIQIALGDNSKPLPNPPYTPLIKTLSLDYTSTQDINIADINKVEQLFHIEPFGSALLNPDSPYLFPQFRDETALPRLKSESALYLGNLYLGIQDLVPPQNLSILFQVAEGSAGINTDIQDEDISWFYLADNNWIPLSTLEIINNTTQGLQTPGIISFSIGADASNNNTLLPAKLYWLRGSIAKDPAKVSQMIDLKTQAVEAAYVLPTDKAIADKHLSQPLPPFSIKELLVKDAAVKSITQTYISFGGKTSERDTSFYTRVSERLRHKKRALELWDFERLILDEFPEIFKVKCLTHTDDVTDLAPGTVSAVVVPNLINKNAINPLQPKVNLLTLQNIRAYVSQYLPLFVTFNPDNPVYEQLLVDFKVGFFPGKDAGFYGNLLNEEIKRFLSPWAYEEGQDITFGGKVFKSDIVVFIESRPYVDFVNSFKLYHIFDGTDTDGPGIGSMAIGTDFIIGEDFFPAIGDMEIDGDFVVGRETEVAVASGPRSILVSAADHRITVLKAGDYKCEGVEALGIGFMIIEESFIVN